MKSKILRVFLALVVALPMFTSVLAISAEDLLARLDEIQVNIKDIKDTYKQDLETYSDVVESLSNESQATIDDLMNGRVLEDGMADRVDALKAELESSNAENADKLLASTKDAEDALNTMIEDNKDIVEEVKGGYTNLKPEEIKQVVDKVVNITEELGLEVDTTETYNDMMKILEEAHSLALDINIRLETIIANNVSTFEDALTLDLVKELLTEVKAKDKVAVIDTLKVALNNANGGAELKAHLQEVKEIAVNLKDKLMELAILPEQDLLMFTDTQKSDVANKIKVVEKDYIDFAKTILDNCVEDYMDVVINLAYDVKVDTMIEYANEALDYYEEYKDTVKSLTAEDVADKLPESMKDLGKKAGLMVALGFVDTTDYNKEYVNANFGTQIENMKKYIANEFVEYLDHIDSTISGEVKDTYNKSGSSELVQKELRNLTAARFNTIENMKKLKSRVDTELLADDADTRADLAQIADYVYEMYYNNIFTSIEAVLMKENEDAQRKYEAIYGGFIVTNKFMPTSDFTEELGIPEKYKDVVEYVQTTNNKIRTGSAFTITLSNTTIGTLQFAVLGDVYIDGAIDARDYMAIKNNIMEKETFSTVRNYAADTYRDKLVDARDYMAIKNYIMKGEEISL